MADQNNGTSLEKLRELGVVCGMEGCDHVPQWKPKLLMWTSRHLNGAPIVVDINTGLCADHRRQWDEKGGAGIPDQAFWNRITADLKPRAGYPIKDRTKLAWDAL